MDELLKHHIERFVKISDAEYEEVFQYFQELKLRKKQNLLSAGAICNSQYFVLKGILRKFFIHKKGVEQTTEFAIENWWMTDTFSYLNHRPSDFFIQAVEPTQVLVIHRDRYDELLRRHRVMETYFRCVYQKAYAAAQMRIRFQFEHSREELYHFFREKEPEFLQRVPQYLIASYLGFTSEYLSQIRRKDIS